MSTLPDQHIGSFVFTIRTHHPRVINGHMGRAIQQFFLNLVGKFDPALAEQLHDGTTGMRPYAVSGLFRFEKLQPVHGAVAADEQVWFRISALNNTVWDALQVIARTITGVTVEIDNAPWTIEHIADSGGGWAAQCSYMQLMAEHMAIHPPSELRLAFDAPTSFHTKGSTVPFPMPTLLFESLISRWNIFSPVVLPELIRSFVEQHISIHGFEGATRSILQKNGHPEVGFVGDVTYTLAKRNPTLHKVDPDLSNALAEAYTPLAQAINMLADFAVFSGVGIKTASGMGMTQHLRSNKR